MLSPRKKHSRIFPFRSLLCWKWCSMARPELILLGFHKLQLPPSPHLWRTLPPLTKTHSELTSISPPYWTQNRCKFKKSPSWTESEFKCPELVRPGHLSKIEEGMHKELTVKGGTFPSVLLASFHQKFHTFFSWINFPRSMRDTEVRAEHENFPGIFTIRHNCRCIKGKRFRVSSRMFSLKPSFSKLSKQQKNPSKVPLAQKWGVKQERSLRTSHQTNPP